LLTVNEYLSIICFYIVLNYIVLHWCCSVFEQDVKTPEEESFEPSQTEVITIASEEDWTNQCGESFRGICAIGLLSPSAEGSETLKGMETIQKAMIGMEKSAGAFRFLIVDAFCQEGFSQSFGFNSHELPTLVVYSPSKQRFQILKGSFSEVRILFQGIMCRVT
jgi:hypothetical protein